MEKELLEKIDWNPEARTFNLLDGFMHADALQRKVQIKSITAGELLDIRTKSELPTPVADAYGKVQFVRMHSVAAFDRFYSQGHIASIGVVGFYPDLVNKLSVRDWQLIEDVVEMFTSAEVEDVALKATARLGKS